MLAENKNEGQDDSQTSVGLESDLANYVMSRDKDIIIIQWMVAELGDVDTAGIWRTTVFGFHNLSEHEYGPPRKERWSDWADSEIKANVTPSRTRCNRIIPDWNFAGEFSLSKRVGEGGGFPQSAWLMLAAFPFSVCHAQP